MVRFLALAVVGVSTLVPNVEAADRWWEVRVGNRVDDPVIYSYRLCDDKGVCTDETSREVRPAQRDRHAYRVRRSDWKDMRLILQWHDGEEWQQREVRGDVDFTKGRRRRIELEPD